MNIDNEKRIVNDLISQNQSVEYKFKIDVDRETIDELLQKWDDNKDGSIDFEEFKKMLKHLGVTDDEETRSSRRKVEKKGGA